MIWYPLAKGIFFGFEKGVPFVRFEDSAGTEVVTMSGGILEQLSRAVSTMGKALSRWPETEQAGWLKKSFSERGRIPLGMVEKAVEREIAEHRVERRKEYRPPANQPDTSKLPVRTGSADPLEERKAEALEVLAEAERTGNGNVARAARDEYHRCFTLGLVRGR